MPQEKYTPGPWKINENPACVMDQERLPLAIVAGDDRNEIMANIRLIAEAPAMFALLQQYLKQHAACKIEGEPDCEEWPCEDCKATRAIIARVLGEE